MTTKLLHIDSAITGEASISRELTQRIVDHYAQAEPGIEIQYLDLAAQTPSHLSADSLGFRLAPDAPELSDMQRRENELTETLLQQFLNADIVVVGAPMYNFTIPSQLKAWIDRLAQAGRTFKYTENGAVGLAGGKRVIVASSRGGAYSTSEQGRALEHQESYLQTIFGFFGITGVQFVRAEGVNLGEEAKRGAMNKALGTITELTALAA
ncbi:FMN-dependent NADH-azoreductase [Pusillimonas noertemannii]|uniref:FMN dependent NADH:quinone oxidoreductase n=1 Tax=Pusillimonas noertemannii TaxID=305977 RepID=A0A2U1CSP1_9BURK|nr:FMN-dependent NADH-azoreductase [Pusillimonas noertemannii]NYT70579.1 FMN-dependent NADH-azoreductase [Pusillimonas noertemannii]PVY68910.1 FMN-dependent NADH-azoreductase [Pusillimonas noertemannii]TFL11642.1 FMN-dependent NADH-azoreductase [Pusillimonas noertemannii]